MSRRITRIATPAINAPAARSSKGYWTMQLIDGIKYGRSAIIVDYNGWTNYETWAVNLWLTNDEHDSAMLSELAQGANDHAWMTQGTGGLRGKSNILKNWVLDENPAYSDASLYADLLHASLERVNWREIIENHSHDNDE